MRGLARGVPTACLAVLAGCPLGDRMAEVDGTVLNEHGGPYSGVLVTLSVTRDGSPVHSDSTHTRQDGSFVFVVDGGLRDEVVAVRAGEGKAVSRVDLHVSWGGSPIVKLTFTLPNAR
jgi:hypothetical protein